MKLFDPDHPFFAPAWRRLSIVGVCLGRALYELLTGAVFWAMLFGALGVWCLYEFFMSPTARTRGRHDDDT